MEHDSQDIRICALVLSVLSFFLFIAAEIVHEEHQQAQRVVVPLVALGALGFWWIGPLTILAGTLRSKKFKWWQPFEGGAEFVCMQAFGWCLHTSILTAAAVVLTNHPVQKWFEGQYLLLGIAGFTAQILLNLSIDCFRESELGHSEFEFALNTKAVVSLLISVSGAMLFILYDLCSHIVQSPVIVAIGCLEFVISALVIHVFYGSMEIPGYRIWQPFEGERTFLLLQYFGWQLFAFTLGGSIILCFSTDYASIRNRPKGTATAVGVMGMVSQVILLISLQYFDGNSNLSSKTSELIKTLERNRRRPRELYVSALLIISAFAVGSVSYLARTRRELLPTYIVRPFLAHEKICWLLSVCALAIASPISHMGGVRSDPFFHWWQPFLGGTKFVFLQTLGWLWYGFFLALSIVLWMNSHMIGEKPAIFVLFIGAASATAVGLSLAYFTPHGGDQAVSEKRFQYAAARGEVTIGVLISISCALFHALVDVFQDRLALPIKLLCLTLGTALSVLGCFITHLSGRKRFQYYRGWQPFEGGTRYVIRQAVGWTLFGVQLLFDSLLLSLVSDRVPSGIPSLIGLFSLIPHGCILSSVEHFKPSTGTDEDYCCQPIIAVNQKGNDVHCWSSLLGERPIRWRAIVNVVVAVGSMSLFVCAEKLHQIVYLRHVEDVLYLFGCFGSMCGMLLGHCVLGPKVHPLYKLYQPFRGGIRFVALQGVAWTLVSIAWVVSCTVLYWDSIFFEIQGIHMVTGLLYFMAQLILLYSLPLFTATEHKETNVAKDNPTDTMNQVVIGPVLGIVACLVFIIVDVAIIYFGPSVPVFPITFCAAAALFSSIPMSYKFASSSFGIQAKTFSGSIVFIVLGCALWSFTLLLGALFSYNVWVIQNGFNNESNTSPSTGFMGTFTGSLGFVAQLFFLQAFEAPQSRFMLGFGCQSKTKSIQSFSKLKDGSMWTYSAIVLVSWGLYTHAQGLIPRNLAANQTFSVLACSIIVVCSAYWIQKQIFLNDRSTKVYSAPTDILSGELEGKHHIMTIGDDCYLHIAGFLMISELIATSSTCNFLHKVHSDHFWHKLFVQGLSGTKAIGSRDVMSMIPKLVVGICPTAPFAVTVLNRLENMTLSFICRFENPLSRNHASMDSTFGTSKWRTLCRARERDLSIEMCKLCNRVEYFSQVTTEWECLENCQRRTPSTWITICNCINPITMRRFRAHRKCIEAQIHGKSLHQIEDGSAIALLCAICKPHLKQDWRLPKSHRELLQLTWEDFRHVGAQIGGGAIFFIPASASVCLCTIRWFEWGSLALYIWVSIVVALCFVGNTTRMDRIIGSLVDVESISFLAYQRLYHALALSSIAHVVWCSSLVAPIDSQSTMFQSALNILFQVKFAFFIWISLVALCAFWRTQYRVATVTELEDNHRTTVDDIIDESGPEQQERRCILCLLQLCNTEN